MNNALLIAVIIVELVILAGSIALIVYHGYQLWYFRNAPYVPSKQKAIDEMMELARVTEGMRTLELGSGSAIISIAAAKRGAHALGLEANPFLVYFSRRRIKKEGLADRVRIEQANFFQTTFPADTDVVFVYLLPPTMTALWPKLCAELKPGTRIISNAFQIAGVDPILVSDKIFVYETKKLS